MHTAGKPTPSGWPGAAPAGDVGVGLQPGVLATAGAPSAELGSHTLTSHEEPSAREDLKSCLLS